MAMIVTMFDTNDKTLKVEVDGVPLENVVEVNHYKRMDYDGDEDGDDFRCSVTTWAKDEATQIRTMTRLCASESIEGKAAAKRSDRPSPLPGFVVADARNRLHEDIASYFGGK